MTKENFKLAEDLLAQISKIETIKSKIRTHYNKSEDNALRELLNSCNDICSALKEIKQKQFENL